MSRGRRRPDAATANRASAHRGHREHRVAHPRHRRISAASVTSINATKGSEQRRRGRRHADRRGVPQQGRAGGGGTDRRPALPIRRSAWRPRQLSPRAIRPNAVGPETSSCRSWIDRAPEATTHIANYSVVPETGKPPGRSATTAAARHRKRSRTRSLPRLRLSRHRLVDGTKVNPPILPEHGESALDREHLVPSPRDAVHLYAHGHAPTLGGRATRPDDAHAAHPLREQRLLDRRTGLVVGRVRPSPCTARPTSTPRTAPGATQ